MMRRVIATVAVFVLLSACAPQRVAKNVHDAVLFSARAKAVTQICEKRSGIMRDRAYNPAHSRVLYSCMRGYGLKDVAIKWPVGGGTPIVESRIPL